ncbi:hypothetical protein SYJ56_06905 [Algoriphagus sp. D3-2-R+10]|uniref:hypothetical protein n=1 Tax=Algoriphagus aurantiacus TaxID=3103948 RepID=UPI002B3AEB63|nr:hypothetical protein [Algoriphagus sp. D3-2-R+10]MEB2775028.1 hypothetical protein [Algoriphagus sp. D3-2-R+10]
MKNFPQLFVLGILGIFLLSSCQEDEEPIDNSSQVIGHWRNSHDLDDNIQMISYYSFLENGNFNSSSVYINSDSDELLGYSGRSSGTYSLLDDQLSIQTTIVYSVPESSDTPYVPTIQLVQSSQNFSSEKTVEFNENQDKMTWIYPPCGPLENCIGSQVFERFTPIEF